MTAPYKLHAASTCLAILAILSIGGCSSQDTLQYEKTDPFVRRVFDAIAAQDLNAYVDLCVDPYDIGVNGKPLMTRQDRADKAWREYYERQFDRLQREIDEAGGVSTLHWVRPGQALGYMKDENEFVGNLYAEVTVGPDARPMVLEIGPTFESEERGRLINEDSAVYLKTWAYYASNVL